MTANKLKRGRPLNTLNREKKLKRCIKCIQKKIAKNTQENAQNPGETQESLRSKQIHHSSVTKQAKRAKTQM